MIEAQAYIEGWKACFAGEDGRFANPYNCLKSKLQCAWTHGFLDAMEAEDNEEPEPSTAGYE